MPSYFSEPIQYTIDRENNMIHLSVRATENKVEVHKISLVDWDRLVTKYWIEEKQG